MNLTPLDVQSLIVAVSHYSDQHLPDLARAFPQIALNGSFDETRSRYLNLLARLKQEHQQKQEPR
jgi:hypothetical protein